MCKQRDTILDKYISLNFATSKNKSPQLAWIKSESDTRILWTLDVHLVTPSNHDNTKHINAYHYLPDPFLCPYVWEGEALIGESEQGRSRDMREIWWADLVGVLLTLGTRNGPGLSRGRF